jgi:hypothetical protein
MNTGNKVHQGRHLDNRRDLPSLCNKRHRAASGDISLRCASFDMTTLIEIKRQHPTATERSELMNTIKKTTTNE